jgi:NlpC/P60 family
VADQPPSPVAIRAVQYCVAAIGTPYVWGGISPNGYDCSGLVYAGYQSAGRPIPRTSEEQWAASTFLDVPWGAWAPGDLIFSQWPGDGARPGHVVIYEGDGTCIAAPHTGTTVQREPVSTFGGSHYVGSKRVAPLKGVATVTGPDTSGTSSAASGDSTGVLAGAGGLALVAIAGVLLAGVVVLVIAYRRKGSSSSSAEPEAG